VLGQGKTCTLISGGCGGRVGEKKGVLGARLRGNWTTYVFGSSENSKSSGERRKTFVSARGGLGKKRFLQDR